MGMLSKLSIGVGGELNLRECSIKFMEEKIKQLRIDFSTADVVKRGVILRQVRALELSSGKKLLDTEKTFNLLGEPLGWES